MGWLCLYARGARVSSGVLWCRSRLPRRAFIEFRLSTQLKGSAVCPPQDRGLPIFKAVYQMAPLATICYAPLWESGRAGSPSVNIVANPKGELGRSGPSGECHRRVCQPQPRGLLAPVETLPVSRCSLTYTLQCL